MEEEKFQGWIATLSNGDTVWETELIPGELRPWQKLITRLNQENLKITSLRVQRGKVTLHALPAKMCDGYYQAYEQYSTMLTGVQWTRQGCGSVVGDKVVIHWTDGNGNVWLDVRPFEKEKSLTTLRDS